MLFVVNVAKSELDRITEEKLAKGGLLAKLYFDMQHKEKDQLQPLMADLINERLLKERGVIYCYGAIEEPIESRELFITSAMVTVLVENVSILVNIAFNYAPAGIEVLRPTSETKLTMAELQSILMSISQLSTNYSKYVLERILKPEDVEKIQKELDNRAAIGKKLLEDKKK